MMNTTGKISYRELIYVSSEKSVLSGMAGFGVRTHTEGLEQEIINRIAEHGLCYYEIPFEKALTYDELVQNPAGVLNFPKTFEFKKIPISDEREIYVFVRSVYIAVDYGHFCGNERALRTGANYISHVLILDEYPPREFFRVIEDNGCFGQQFFLPLDYTCKADNPELVALLTGEPVLLPPRSVMLSSSGPEIRLTAELGELLVGGMELAQLKKSGPSDRPVKNKLIVKAPDRLTEQLVSGFFAVLPAEFTGSLCFATNYRKAGVPDDLDIVFVNENFTDCLYEEDYLFVDTCLHKTLNIRANRLYDRIRRVAAEGDLKELRQVFDFLKSRDLQRDSDFDFLDRLYEFSGNMERPIAELPDRDFIQNLYRSAETALVGKVKKNITDVVNRVLQLPGITPVNEALEAFREIAGFDSKIWEEIQGQTARIFTSRLLEDQVFWEGVMTEEHVEIAVKILDRQAMNRAEVYDRLETTSSVRVWLEVLRLDEDRCLQDEERVKNIIGRMLCSPLTEADYMRVLDRLAGSEIRRNEVVWYFVLEHPAALKPFQQLVRKEFESKGESVWPELIGCMKGKEEIAILIPWIKSYFIPRFEQAERLSSLLENVTRWFGVLALNPGWEKDREWEDLTERVVAKIAGFRYAFTEEEIKELEVMARHKVFAGPEPVRRQLKRLSDMLHDVEITDPSPEDSVFLLHQQKKEAFMKVLVMRFRKERLSVEELKTLIKEKPGVNREDIGEIIVRIWKNKDTPTLTLAKKLVKCAVDCSGWNKKELEEFMTKVKDEELSKLLEQKNSFFNRLVRSVFGK